MILEIRAVEPFMKNGFVLGCEETGEGIVIDPGDDVDLLLEAVERHGLSIPYILLTHAHLDHITGVAKARKARARGSASTRRSLSVGGGAAGPRVCFHVDRSRLSIFFDSPAMAFWHVRSVGASHAGSLPGGRVPGGGPRWRPGPNVVRGRYALCRRHRPNGPARWRHVHAASIHPTRALQLS
jgi:hypothetical protein